MKITDALRNEHVVFYAELDRCEEMLRSGASLDDLRAQAGRLAEGLLPHAELENELLFSALEPALGEMGPLAVMRAEHDEIDGNLPRIASVQSPGEARQLLAHTVAVARQHFLKEEQVLFPIADRILDAGTLEQLGAQWTARRPAPPA